MTKTVSLENRDTQELFNYLLRIKIKHKGMKHLEKLTFFWRYFLKANTREELFNFAQ